METREIALLAVNALEDKKAEDIRIIDISNISTIADYFIIADGSNKSQIQAMTDNVSEALGRAGVTVRQIEGYQNANWIKWIFRISSFIYLTVKTVCFTIWRGSGVMGKRWIQRIFERL